MDHLPVPEYYQDRQLVVYHRKSSVPYDFQGFKGFPDRIGVHIHGLVTGTTELPDDSDEEPSSWLESFLQEWLWFGMLHEFEIACGLPIDWQCTSTLLPDSARYRINTEWFGQYAREIANGIARNHGVPLKLEVGDWVYVEDGSKKRSDYGADVMEIWDDIIEENELLTPTEQQLGPFEVIEVISPIRVLLFVQNIPGTATNECDVIDNSLVCLKSARKVGSIADETESETGVFKISAIDICENFSFKAKKLDVVLFPALVDAIVTARQTLTDISHHYEEFISTSTIIAIDVMCDSLEIAIQRICGDRCPTLRYQFFSDQFDLFVAQKNWCASKTNKQMTSSSTSLCYIMSLLDSYEERSHTSCSTYRCEYKQEDFLNVKVRHDQTFCSEACESLIFEPILLVDIISTGGIPAVKKSRHSNGEIKFTICDVTGKDYVAISHVWTHGMGNKYSNGLPICQIKALFARTEAIEGPEASSCIWIDTMCVPTGGQYKRIAIQRMRQVYSEAKFVLVIDRQLLCVGKHWLDRRLHLLNCEWLRRLWTFQEAKIARQIWIQFKDEAVQAEELSAPTEPLHEDEELFNHLRYYTSAIISPHFVLKEDMMQRCLDIAEDLSYRTTTVATDEPICLSVIMDRPCQKSSTNPTLEDIFKELVIVPQSILFVWGHRLPSPGFRWAPRSFLNTGGQIFPQFENNVGYVTKYGLLLRTCCVVIQEALTIEMPAQYRDAPLFTMELDHAVKIAIEVNPASVRLMTGKTALVERLLIIFKRDINEIRKGKLDSTDVVLAACSLRPEHELPALIPVQFDSMQYSDNVRDGLTKAQYCNYRFQALCTIMDNRYMLTRKWTGDGSITNRPHHTNGRLMEDMWICID